MSAALPPTVNKQSLLAIKSKGRVVKCIEQMKFSRGDGKFTANVVTPLQYTSAGDSPPTKLNIIRFKKKPPVNISGRFLSKMFIFGYYR